MDYSGTIPATGVPPPAPPPPPPTLNTSKILGSSWRTSTNRDNIGSVQTAKSPERSLPFAGVHPETLQHAAQRLRPTVYRESLLPHEREQFLDGSDQLATGRYWQNQPQHDTLAQHQTGTTIHATHDYSHQSPAFGLNSGYSPSMSPNLQQQQQSSNFNSNNNKQYQQYSYKPQQKQNMEIKIPIQLIGPLPGQTNFGPKSSYSPTPSPINSFIKQTSQQTTFNHSQSPLLQQQQHQQSSSSSQQQQLINDPKRYIHAYATQTPVATLMTGQNGGGIRGENNFGRENDFVANNGSGGIHLRKQNVDNFVKELRDQGLTERQRVANQQQKPVNYSTSEPPPSLQNFVSYKQKIINSNLKEENNKEQDSVDQLIKEMEWKMRSGYGAAGENYCTKCRQQISGDPPGVTALGQPYHVTCFCCDQCQKQLAGCSFYAVDGKNLCQVDYMNSLEKCGKCKMPITQKILRALGKAFHPECFVCPTCQKSLDGIQFTVDSENSAYCLDCFHERFSPRCASCLKVIAPSGNETEVARVIAMDRSYHLDCYKCEDCGLKLNSKIEGQGCYPLESHLFCKNCNLKRLKLVK